MLPYKLIQVRSTCEDFLLKNINQDKLTTYAYAIIYIFEAYEIQRGRGHTVVKLYTN